MSTGPETLPSNCELPLGASSSMNLQTGVACDSVHCPSCGDHFRRSTDSLPWVSTCGHSVCGSCRSAGVAHGQTCCLVCFVDNVTYVENFTLADYAEAVFGRRDAAAAESGLPCVSCLADDDDSTEPATFKCAVCVGKAYCGEHAASHAKVKKHDVLPLNPFAAAASNGECGLHKGGVLNFYCMDHKVPVCRDCTVMDHPTSTHNVVPMSSAVATLTSLLQALIPTCESTSKHALQYSDAVKAATGRMAVELQQSVDGFKAQVDDVKTALDKHCAAVIADAERVCRERTKQLDAQTWAVGVGHAAAGRGDAESCCGRRWRCGEDCSHAAERGGTAEERESSGKAVRAASGGHREQH